MSAHEDTVWNVRPSPRGDRIVSASQDGTARVWNASTGAPVLTLRHGGPVWLARFSPGGRQRAHLVHPVTTSTPADWVRSSADAGRRSRGIVALRATMPVTIAAAAKYASSLPGVTVGTKWGNRTWMVGNQGFAWQRPLTKADIERFGDTPLPTGEILAVRVESLDAKDALLGMDLPGFFTIPHFNGYAAVLIELAKARAKDVRAAILDAHRTVAHTTSEPVRARGERRPRRRPPRRGVAHRPARARPRSAPRRRAGSRRDRRRRRPRRSTRRAGANPSRHRPRSNRMVSSRRTRSPRSSRARARSYGGSGPPSSR